VKHSCTFISALPELLHRNCKSSLIMIKCGYDRLIDRILQRVQECVLFQRFNFKPPSPASQLRLFARRFSYSLQEMFELLTKDPFSTERKHLAFGGYGGLHAMAFAFPQKDSPKKDSAGTLHNGILSAYDGLDIHVQEKSLGGGEKVFRGINSQIQ
jgi:hypothetical protein